MGLISDWLKKREITRLMRAIETSPTPEIFVQLVLAYQDERDLPAALRAAKQGAQMFPTHPQLISLRDSMERHERNAERERLRQKIQSFPNPTLFARLAELYKAEGLFDKAIEVCKSGLSNYPNYGGTYLVMGQIHLAQGDSVTAQKQLETAVQFEPYNYTALKLLAETCLNQGLAADAIRWCDQVLDFAPGDQEVMAFRKKAEQLGSAAAAPAGLASPPPGAGAVRGATAVRGRGTLVKGAARPTARSTVRSVSPAAPSAATPGRTTAGPAVPIRGRPTSRSSPEEMLRRKKANLRSQVINNAITSFTGLDGVRGAVLVDMYGLVIASDMGIDIPDDLAAAMITNVYRTTVQSADYLEVGEFEDGLVEGERGFLHIFNIQEMILAVFADVQLKQGMLLEVIRDFIRQVDALKQNG